MSSPLDNWQWTASYRATVNFNYAGDTTNYDFFTNSAALFFTHHPLAKTSYGLKLASDYTFQNQPDASGNSAFRPYSLTGEMGLYLKTQLTRKTLMMTELYFKPQNYSNDVDGPTARSGPDFLLKDGFTYDAMTRYWNPTAAVSLS